VSEVGEWAKNAKAACLGCGTIDRKPWEKNRRYLSIPQTANTHFGLIERGEKKYSQGLEYAEGKY